jgi:hypothetical protein
MPNFKWWLARLLMRLRGERGCKGEGFTKEASGNLVVCYRHGCH